MPTARNSGTFQVVLPQVPDALELLADDGGAYLIDRATQDAPLRVLIATSWPVDADDPPGTQSMLQLYWDNATVGAPYVFTWPFDPDQVFPFTAFVPREFLTAPGIHRLKYEVMLWSENEAFSDEILINIDREAPNHDNRGERLGFDDQVIEQGVTDAYLELNRGRLPAIVPRWSDIREGDLVEYFVGVSADPSHPSVLRGGSLRVGPEHVAGAAVEVFYPQEVLAASGNGYRYVFYFLTDRAGNQNPRSRAEYLNVQLRGPIVLPAPVVPLAEFDRLIDLEDVRRGVEVHIPFIAEALAGDRIQAYWNNRPLAPFFVAANQAWPLRLPVSWEVVSADGFASVVPCVVRYEGSRGTQPPLDAPAVTFMVDLTVAGPDPVGPDPINPWLKPVVVKGLTGDNVLTLDDYERDAEVRVLLFDQPQAGDLLQLHWGNETQVVATYRVKAQDRAGDWVTFSPVPWAVIETTGSGNVPVHYWTFNDVNRQRSPATRVRVQIPVLTELGPVTFPDATLFGWINCNSRPWDGIRVHVPVDVRMSPGDQVSLTWQLCRQTNGEVPMPGALKTFSKTLNAQDLRGESIEIRVEPFDTLVLPLWPASQPRPNNPDGSAQVGYTLQLVDGRFGIAPPTYVSISLTRPGASKPCTGR